MFCGGSQEVLEEFLRLFPLLFSANQNARFSQAVTSSFERRQWKRLSAGLRDAAKTAIKKVSLLATDSHGLDDRWTCEDVLLGGVWPGATRYKWLTG